METRTTKRSYKEKTRLDQLSPRLYSVCAVLFMMRAFPPPPLENFTHCSYVAVTGVEIYMHVTLSLLYVPQFRFNKKFETQRGRQVKQLVLGKLDNLHNVNPSSSSDLIIISSFFFWGGGNFESVNDIESRT